MELLGESNTYFRYNLPASSLAQFINDINSNSM